VRKAIHVRHALQIPALLSCLIILFSTNVAAQPADSTHVTPKKTPGKAVSVFLAPAVLIGTGIATMDDRGWYSSQDAYECIQRNYPGFHTNVDDYLWFLPAASVYGLNLAGVKGKNNFVDRSVVYLVSLTLAGLGNSFIKSVTKVTRPDGSDDRSFPSTHTTLAFVSATFLHEEYKHKSFWYSIAGYSVATVTGILRMMNNEHWMSDVLVGAGLGILTTKIVYWVDPLLRKRQSHTPGKRGNDQLTFLPYLAPDHYGVYLQYTLR
jgi:membrane-associated phospholipid phosphatase